MHKQAAIAKQCEFVTYTSNTTYVIWKDTTQAVTFINVLYKTQHIYMVTTITKMLIKKKTTITKIHRNFIITGNKKYYYIYYNVVPGG